MIPPTALTTANSAANTSPRCASIHGTMIRAAVSPACSASASSAYVETAVADETVTGSVMDGEPGNLQAAAVVVEAWAAVPDVAESDTRERIEVAPHEPGAVEPCEEKKP